MKFKAFTLIELMVVMAIIVIIATASVPQIQLWIARNNGVSAVSTIVSEFSKARSIAGYSVKQRATGITGLRSQTALYFNNTAVAILQRDTMTVGSWNINESIRTVSLPNNVSILYINGNSLTSPYTTIFSSTGRLKKSDGSLVPFGAGLGNLVCGATSSPLNGRIMFSSVLLSSVGAQGGIWYRVEIDETGNYAVCSVAKTTLADFNEENAGYIEL